VAARYSKELTELIKKFNLTKDEVWDCHGTMVMLHRACEKVALQLGILFDSPEVLLAEGESIAILVTGYLKEADKETAAWSIGEASPKNNKNAYPWAMAEKRAKDRVILKLARFNEVGVYSDIEADDFKKPGYADRECYKGERSPELKETLSQMETTDSYAVTDVAKVLNEHFGGDRDAALDWLQEKGLPVPTNCSPEQLQEMMSLLS